ncbi:neuronal PAS domain-containing protein 4A [Latimeria chalumnae]|uniref:neuronal PAS domain-containing protein 4A n=1 Tax=Latimeria chalumnae TaxID=7897 RepID=UPI00313BF41C
MYRSTKGASKARRDQINAEIRNLKELLPIAEEDKARLSYLHIMSVACIYTRKSVFFSQGAPVQESAELLGSQELDDFMQTLPGFLLVMTSEGKLIYISETIAEYLGHSMVDLVAQGDSVYDIIDPADHFPMRNHLALSSATDTERLFRCRFNTSKSVRRQSAGNKLVLVRGRFHQPPAGSYWSSNPVFIAFCVPLDPKPRQTETSFFLAMFESKHSKDMSILDASDSVTVYLGYEKEELLGTSWYNLIHPEDVCHASSQHYRSLSESNESRVEMVIRLQSKDLCWIWIYIILHMENADVPATCYNYIISESEAWCLREQLTSEETQLALLFSTAVPYQESILSPGQLSSPDQVFTPVSSTPTSGFSVQSFDFSGVYNVDCSQDYTESAITGQEHQTTQMGSSQGNISSSEDTPGSTSSRQQEKPSDFTYNDCMFFSTTSYEQTFRNDLLNSSSKEFVCTPPYTPQQGGCTFMFGTSESFPQTTTSDLYYPPENCSALYEKLPPTPDSPGNGDCTVMIVPEVRTPLFIDVPMVPEGLLTPEASPIKQCFFRYSEKEKTEISILAKQISSLAECFNSFANKDISLQEQPYAKHNLVIRSSSLPINIPTFPSPTNLDLQPLKHWRSVDFSVLTSSEEALLEDNVLENILTDLSTPLSQKSGSGVRCHHQLCGDAMAPSPSTDLSPEEQSFLEELASYETVFETCASRSPCDGFNDELYQLQSHMQDSFHQDGSGGDPSF